MMIDQRQLLSLHHQTKHNKQMENKITKEEIRNYVLSEAEDYGGFARGSLSEENDIECTLMIDSLDRIDFINGIENHFEVRFNIDDEEDMTTFKDIVEAVWRKKQ